MNKRRSKKKSNSKASLICRTSKDGKRMVCKSYDKYGCVTATSTLKIKPGPIIDAPAMVCGVNIPGGSMLKFDRIVIYQLD